MVVTFPGVSAIVLQLEKVSECSDVVQGVVDPDHVRHEVAFVPDDDFLGSFLPRQQTAMVCPLSVGKKTHVATRQCAYR